MVTLATWKTLLDSYEKPCVFIQIKYTKGLDGTNILVLKEHENAKWLTKQHLGEVEWLPADVTLIEKIRRYI